MEKNNRKTSTYLDNKKLILSLPPLTHAWKTLKTPPTIFIKHKQLIKRRNKRIRKIEGIFESGAHGGGDRGGEQRWPLLLLLLNPYLRYFEDILSILRLISPGNKRPLMKTMPSYIS